MQAREVCKPERCASRRGVQVKEVCKPEKVCKPNSDPGGRRRDKEGEEVCKPDKCASQIGGASRRDVQTKAELIVACQSRS